MYLPIRTLRTSGIPKCRIASRTAFPCGSNTAAFGITITLAFIPTQYFCGSSATSAIPVRSFQDDNFERATPTEHDHAHVAFVVSREEKIHAGACYFQITNTHLREKLRQKWLRKHKLSFRSKHFESKTTLQQEKYRPGGPRLGSTGHRIQRRRLARPPRKTAKQFGQPMQIEKDARVHQAREHH